MTAPSAPARRRGDGVLLSQLTDNLQAASLAGGDVEIGGVAFDSRAVAPGDLFFALRGTAVDGHRFVRDAVAAGAAAVVVEEAVAGVDVPTVVVPDTAKALAAAAARWYGDPADGLVLCGITGTNGKSSTAHMLRAMVNASALGRAGIIGTLGHGTEALVRTAHTTPDAVTLHRSFRAMADDGCYGVVMEVSSHAVRQHRVWGLDFAIGILTNVTHDHLDFHRSLEEYREAKAEFCRALADPGRRKPQGTLVYWRDDPVAREIGESHAGKKVSVGSTPAADVHTSAVESTLAGTRFTVHLRSGGEVAVAMKLMGSFVAVNAALAAAAAEALGVETGAIAAALASLERVPGRFETMGGGPRPTVVIDYAHTPDAVEQVLATCRGLGAQRLFVVFGCGGDRDRTKRPLMGRVAAAMSDACFVTTDNPRREPVQRIVADILAGVADPSRVRVELDRSRAIREAIAAARPGDVVVLLGKGHEDYQIIGEEKLPFSDRREAEGALQSWSAR
jgi:UDP-N-acetylmuramoyl-L-alanyl-D-glutamate--2,6-diaminopimelate ligase